ncbi:HNH endonuclease signature motif containing protein, partial [Microbacterium sp. AR7-10]|uniref:HNH endonuclease signature motif containing protein n=1 Tax=Microbacterium sp. AR7-10 TaxID=1891970 RepID=UPI000A69EF74
MTEVHHIDWWNRDTGPTDLTNGILLCSTCHHRIHDNGWEPAHRAYAASVDEREFLLFGEQSSFPSAAEDLPGAAEHAGMTPV